MAKEKDIYLVAQYTRRPKDKSKTIRKGYINDDNNVSYDESVTLSRGLKDRDLKAAIILNLTQKTVHKCRFDDANNWEKLAAYYAKAYPQYIQLIEPQPDPEEMDIEDMAAVEVPLEEEAAEKTAEE
jgi:hypothetical protein